jgi:hypothetical protein
MPTGTEEVTTLAQLEAELCQPLEKVAAERFGSTPYMLRQRPEQCHRGHWFTIENTGRNSDGRRYCRTCHRLAQSCGHSVDKSG